MDEGVQTMSGDTVDLYVEYDLLGLLSSQLSLVFTFSRKSSHAHAAFSTESEKLIFFS